MCVLRKCQLAELPSVTSPFLNPFTFSCTDTPVHNISLFIRVWLKARSVICRTVLCLWRPLSFPVIQAIGDSHNSKQGLLFSPSVYLIIPIFLHPSTLIPVQLCTSVKVMWWLLLILSTSHPYLNLANQIPSSTQELVVNQPTYIRLYYVREAYLIYSKHKANYCTPT